MEKVLGQGKLQTMMQVKEEIKSTYKEEVPSLLLRVGPRCCGFLRSWH